MEAMVGSEDRPGIEPDPAGGSYLPVVMSLRVETNFSVAMRGPLGYIVSLSRFAESLEFGTWSLMVRVRSGIWMKSA